MKHLTCLPARIYFFKSFYSWTYYSFIDRKQKTANDALWIIPRFLFIISDLFVLLIIQKLKCKTYARSNRALRKYFDIRSTWQIPWRKRQITPLVSQFVTVSIIHAQHEVRQNVSKYDYDSIWQHSTYFQVCCWITSFVWEVVYAIINPRFNSRVKCT